MKQYAVYFQEKQLLNADLPWEHIQGVTLTVQANDDNDLADKVASQIERAADYQLQAQGIEASYMGSWVDDSGTNRQHELVPNSMWGGR